MRTDERRFDGTLTSEPGALAPGGFLQSLTLPAGRVTVLLLQTDQHAAPAVLMAGEGNANVSEVRISMAEGWQLAAIRPQGLTILVLLQQPQQDRRIDRNAFMQVVLPKHFVSGAAAVIELQEKAGVVRTGV